MVSKLTTNKKHSYPAWVEVDLQALSRNYQTAKKLARKHFTKKLARKGPETIRHRPHILAVIKADAYGHGMLPVASVLNKLGVDYFGVSDTAEGLLLRRHGLRKPILLFESTLPSSVPQIVDYDLTPTVCTIPLAAALHHYARRRNKKIDIHIPVDTGMVRLGIRHDQAADFIAAVRKYSSLSIQGIYTHFPLADTNARYTRNQIKLLDRLVDELDEKGTVIPYVHAANSMGLAAYQTDILNLVRPGLMLYGLYPHKRLKDKVTLDPVMTVKTRVIFIRSISKGTGISYGHTYVAKKDMNIAVLSIGYNDGFLRCLSNKACVLIDGKRCRVLGRVTMDQIMVDVSNVKSVKLGSEAVILGRQKGNHISADDLASWAGTINYEIVCSLGNRLPRIYK